MKDKAGECRHPDCIYRNRSDPVQSGQCNYMQMTGHGRIVGLAPKEQEPRNCPRYISDGTTRKTRAVGRDWHAEAERLYREGHTDHEIADAVGVNYGTVQWWRREVLREDPNPDRRKSAFSWERARDLYLAGLNDREIAEKLGCSANTVWRWRTKYELFPNGKVGPKKNIPQSAAPTAPFRQGGQGRKEETHENQSTGEPVQRGKSRKAV